MFPKLIEEVSVKSMFKLSQAGPKSNAAFNEELNVMVLVSVTMVQPLVEDSNNSTPIDSSELAGVYCPDRSELSALKNPFPFVACQ